MNSSTILKMLNAERMVFWIGVSARYVYTIGLAVLTLSLVIVTLAAYQFQIRITDLEIKSTENGVSSKAELDSELRLLQARYRDFKRYADDRWAVFLDAERRVNDELRPVLYAQVRAERRETWPWLEPIKELPVVDGRGPLASLTSQPAAASDNPSASNAEDAALASAIEAHREYLNYAKLLY